MSSEICKLDRDYFFQDNNNKSCCDYLNDIATGIRRHPCYKKFSIEFPYQKEALKVISYIVQSKIFAVFAGPYDNGDSNFYWFNQSNVILWTGRVKFIGGLIMGMISLYTMISKVIELSSEKEKVKYGGNRAYEITSAIFQLIQSVGGIAIAVSTTVIGLSMMGVIGSGILAWAPMLMMIGTGITAIEIAIDLVERANNRRVLNKLEDVEISLDDKCDWLLGELKNSKTADGDYFLTRHFEIIDKETYNDCVTRILKYGEKEDKERVLENLKTRIRQKSFSHKIAVLVNIIGLIGAFILFFPVLGTSSMALICLSAASLIAIIRYYRDKKSILALEESLRKPTGRGIEMVALQPGSREICV